MPRVLTFIFAFAALIVQIGMGALPGGGVCVCIPVAAERPSCCCDDEGECGVPVQRCYSCRDGPCRDGCEHCICVPTHDGRATLSAGPRKSVGDGEAVAAMLFGAPAPVRVGASAIIGAAPRATESPPHLGPLRTTRLII